MKRLILILLMFPLFGFSQWGSDIYECKIPTCTTILRSVSANYQELGYIVTSNGGCSFEYTGLIYSNNNPNVNYGSYDGAYLGPRSSGFLDQGLTTYTFAPGSTIYFRAVAINYKGIGYGDIISFIVPGGTSPSISILAATSITSTSAIVGGNVTAQGSSFVTARGITWGTTPQNSYVNDINCGNGIGSYTTTISGLTSGTTYYYSAYATNSNGTTLSSMGSFTTTSSQSLPTLVTNSISSITTNSATSGGNTINDGGAPIIEKGVCWSTSPNPTYSNSNTNDGSGTSSFTSSISGLNPATTYYVRAYAKNRYDNGSFISYAVGYGNELSFTTSGNLPTVSNDLTAYNVTASSAQAVGNVTSDGGLTVIARGFVYSLSSASDPTTTNNLGSTSNGSGTGGFSASIIGLNAGTSYKFRAYAINSAGTSYGTIVNFTTVSVSCNLASLTTISISGITEDSANSGGNILNDGGCSITARGVCWNTTGSPNISNSNTVNGNGIGSFSSSITGLSCGTTYYVRAYATNSSGTSYGNELSFTTQPTLLAIGTGITFPNYPINPVQVISGFNNYGCNLIERGIVWSTSPNPTTLDNKYISPSNAEGVFSFLIPVAAGTYYFSGYAINNIGTSYYNYSYPLTIPGLVSIGSSYQGGMVAYIFQPGDPGYISGETHGIIAASSDQSSGIQWYNGTYITTGASSEGVLGGGLSNTSSIVSAQGVGSYAAKLCYDLTLNGYSDWVLPNMGELRVLYTNRIAIGGFTTGSYWSSYEGTSIYAGLKSFNNGDEQTGNKSANWILVRAIRYF